MNAVMEKPAAQSAPAIEVEFVRLTAELRQVDSNLAAATGGDPAMRSMSLVRRLKESRVEALQKLVLNRRAYGETILPGILAGHDTEYRRALAEHAAKPKPITPVDTAEALHKKILAFARDVMGCTDGHLVPGGDTALVLNDCPAMFAARAKAEAYRRNPPPEIVPVNAGDEIRRRAESELRALESELTKALSEAA